jgi:hypothetical protein
MSSMTHFWRVGVLVAGLALVAVSARAEDSQRAKEMFRQGSVYFDLGQYDRAIEVWQRGYEEKQDPSFLYNLAQAYRLSGDSRKAILFYKSFLRNSPKAPNRVEIEQKIAALQNQVSSGETAPAPGAASAPASRAAAPAPATPASVPAAGAAASATAPPPPSSPSAEASPASGRAPALPAAATEVVVTSSGSSPTPTGDRPFDLGVALGGNFWMLGVNGSAQPSFSFAAGAGYTFPPNLANLGRRARFRLGALIAYTFLDDVGSKVSFISALVDPTVRIRISPERLFLNADVGVGVLAVAGLQQSSSLLVHDRVLAVNGTQSAFEVRPGLSVEYRFRPTWALVVGSGLAYSPKRTYFYQSMLRLELHLGFVLRM